MYQVIAMYQEIERKSWPYGGITVVKNPAKHRDSFFFEILWPYIWT